MAVNPDRRSKGSDHKFRPDFMTNSMRKHKATSEVALFFQYYSFATEFCLNKTSGKSVLPSHAFLASGCISIYSQYPIVLIHYCAIFLPWGMEIHFDSSWIANREPAPEQCEEIADSIHGKAAL